MGISTRATQPIVDLQAGDTSPQCGIPSRPDHHSLPVDWSSSALGSGNLVLRVGSGLTPTGGRKVYKESGRPFVRSQNVGWGHLLLDDLAYIDDATHDSFSGSEIVAGDVLLNITGASIGRSAVASQAIAGGNVNQHVCEIRTDNSKLNPTFLCALLLSEIGQRQIDSFQAGGNRQGLNFGQIRSIVIPLPPHSEQHAISEALSDVDSLITALNALIAKKRAIKLATMQQLLTGRTRLPGFEGEWKTKRLGDLGTVAKGKGIRKDDVESDGISCVRYGEIYTHHNDYIRQFYSFISRSVASESYRLRTGDLLFAGSGETASEIGKCVALLGAEEAYAGSDIVVFTPSAQDSMFLGYFLNRFSARDQMTRMGQGDAVVHISATNLASLEVALPDPDEQRAIAQILSDMDAEIDALETRVAKTRDTKQGMMQQLLTGRIRLVPPTPEEVPA